MGVRGGVACEPTAAHGLTHFVEHMLFRGAGEYGDPELLDEFVKLGATMDAETFRDAMVLQARCLNAAVLVKRIVALFGMIAASPRFENLEAERSVVALETQADFNEEGRLTDPESLIRMQAWDSPMARPILGSPSIVANVTRGALLDWHRQLFVGKNMCVGIACRDPDKIVKTIRDSFAKLPSGQAMTSWPTATCVGAPVWVQPAEAGTVTLFLSYPLPPDARHVAAVLEQLADNGITGGLRQSIVNDAGLAYSLLVESVHYEGAGRFDVTVECAPDTAMDVLKRTVRSLRALRDVSVEAVEQARRLTECEYASGETAASQAYREVLETLSGHTLLDVSKVSARDVAALAQQAFRPKLATLLVSGDVTRELVADVELFMGREVGTALWLEELPDADEGSEGHGGGDDDIADVDFDLPLGGDEVFDTRAYDADTVWELSSDDERMQALIVPGSSGMN